jgi:uroporphyrinogen-III synthase
VSLLPLAGRRVLVTRAAHQAGKLSEWLRALGAEPVEVPVLEIRPPESFTAMDAALADLSGYDWLILTSANTVRALAERAVQQGIVLSQSAELKVAAVGEATAEAGRQVGLSITMVPEPFVAESLILALAGKVKNKKILLLRAAVARDLIPNALRDAGGVVDVVKAYRNVLPENAAPLLRTALSQGLDAATFTSSSSVQHLLQVAQAAGVAWPLEEVKAASIGPITSQTLRESGWEPAVEAIRSDISGLIDALTRLLGPGIAEESS